MKGTGMKFWGMILIGVLGFAILMGLGIWQVQRLAWKQGVLADIENRISADVQTIPTSPDASVDLYLPVTVSGQFETDTIRVLVSQKIYGAGYRLINAIITTDGRRILVDRGFVTVNATQMPPVPAGTVRVDGNLHWPQEIDRFTPDNDIAANIWFSRDVPTLAQHLRTEGILIVARKVEGDDEMQPLPVGVEGIPNDHLQYAITWFSLAAIWLGMMGYFVYRMRKIAS